MFDEAHGGGTGDLDYGRFTSDLFAKVGRFAELYCEKMADSAPSTPSPVLSEEYQSPRLEEDAQIGSYVMPFVDAPNTVDLPAALVADEGLIMRLTGKTLTGTSTYVEEALTWIDRARLNWVGTDAVQFAEYCLSVQTAIQRQESLLEALGAVAEVHVRMVSRARQDLLDLIDAANTALEESGDSGLSGLTLLSTVFAIGASLTTGGAAAGLGLAGTLVGAAASLSTGDSDQVGDAVDYGFGDDPRDIRTRTLELIEELATGMRDKNSELADVTEQLHDIVVDGTAQVRARDLLPREPNLYRESHPDFRLTDAIPVPA